MRVRQSLGESSSSEVFQKTFIDEFTRFHDEVVLLARGNAEINDTWLDTLLKEGLGLSVTVVLGVIAILGSLAVLSAVVSAGIAIPVAVCGAALGVGFHKWRQYSRQKQYSHAAALLQNEDISAVAEQTAKQMAALYQVQLNNCTLNDAEKLAQGCMQVVSKNMLTNDRFSLSELFYPATLQALLMRSLTNVPQKKLDMNILTKNKYRLRSLISHSAYYCRETDEFYCTSKSKPAKYGVLLFDKKSELEDYEAILSATTLLGMRRFRLQKMREHDVGTMLGGPMFQTYRNERLFEDLERGEALAPNFSDNAMSS